MILGSKTRYAVMAMVELAKATHGKPVTVATLAKSQEITVPYLEQIFSKLKQNNIVQSVRGPGGGYVLAHPADRIRILDIVQAVDESLKMTRCDAHETTGCMSQGVKCSTHDLWQGLTNQIQHYLGAISLADIQNNNLPSQHVRNIETRTTH